MTDMSRTEVQAKNHGRTVIFDVDGTLKTREGYPESLPVALDELRGCGYSLGICSSQSPTLYMDFLTQFRTESGKNGLFDSWVILEDGHVLVPPGGSPLTESIVLTEADCLIEMTTFERIFISHWRGAEDEELAKQGWGSLDDDSCPPVKLVPRQWRPVGTLSIWELGPAVTSPEYNGEFERVMLWAERMAISNGLTTLEFREVGNGTLCVEQKGISKGTGLLYSGLPLDQIIFVGDGYNDVPAAHVLRPAGGKVVAVANAVSELKAVADHVTERASGYGVLELALSLREASKQ